VESIEEYQFREACCCPIRRRSHQVASGVQVFKTKLEMAGLQSPAHDDLIKIMFKAYLPTEMSLWASNYGGQLTWDEMQEQFLKEFAPTRSSDVAKQDAWESLKQGAGESIRSILVASEICSTVCWVMCLQ